MFDKLKVLLLEDETDILELLRYFLEQNGCYLLGVDSIEVLSKINFREEKIDIIVTDVNMGNRNALDFWENPEVEKAIAGVSVLVMSGRSENNERAKKLKGFKGFIDKPFTAQKLLDLITSVLLPAETE